MYKFLWVIAAVVAGMLKRLAFDGEMVEGYSKRLAGNYGFTGFRLFTSYVLLWVAVIPVLRMDWTNIKLWLVTASSFTLWQTFYVPFIYPFDVDPSGHIACTLVALSIAETQADGRSTLGRAFYWCMFLHSLWCLFFTSYVYHTVFESYLGLTVGLVLILGSRVAFKPFSDLIDLMICKRTHLKSTTQPG